MWIYADLLLGGVYLDKRTERLDAIRSDFENCKKAMATIGNKTRQAIIIALVETTYDSGMRLGEISRRTNLSKPTVSYQLNLLKEANMVRMRKIGTMTFYYIDMHANFQSVKSLISHLDEAINEFSSNRQDELGS